jgi:hypothetical protein
MSNIAISDLHSTDFDLLSNSDSYMRELSDEELNAQRGGFIAVDDFLIGLMVGYTVGWVCNLIDSLFG